MKYQLSRVDGKGKKVVIYTGYADSYTVLPDEIVPQVIPYTVIRFLNVERRFLREPKVTAVATVLVSGDWVVEEAPLPGI